MAIVTKVLQFGQKALTSALLRRGFRNDNQGTVVRDFSPRWLGHFNKKQYQYIYELSPILKGIIDYKARASANVKRFVKDLGTGEILMPDTTDKGALKIYNLLKKPNPYQSEFEFFNQRKVNFEIFGDTYMYASMPEGFRKVSFLDITNLINLPSQYTRQIHTGKVLDQTSLDGIVSKYQLEAGMLKRDFDPSTILHRNDINISGFSGNAMNNDFGVTSGGNRLESLMMPLSNIQRS